MAAQLGALAARQHRRQPRLGEAQALDRNDRPRCSAELSARIMSPSFSGDRGKAAGKIKAVRRQPVAIPEAPHQGRRYQHRQVELPASARSRLVDDQAVDETG